MPTQIDDLSIHTHPKDLVRRYKAVTIEVKSFELIRRHQKFLYFSHIKIEPEVLQCQMSALRGGREGVTEVSRCKLPGEIRRPIGVHFPAKVPLP